MAGAFEIDHNILIAGAVEIGQGFWKAGAFWIFVLVEAIWIVEAIWMVETVSFVEAIWMAKAFWMAETYLNITIIVELDYYNNLNVYKLLF